MEPLRMRLTFTNVVGVVIILAARATGVQIFASPESLPENIPQDCRTALSANITCPALLKASELLYRTQVNETFLEEYCDCTCTDSLTSWSDEVGTKCGSTPYPIGPDVNLTVSAITEPLRWAQEVACLTDKEDCDKYCLASVVNGTAKDCDDCMFQYQAGMLGSKYGDTRINEASFTSLLSSCGANPTDYPHSTPTRDPLPPYPTNLPIITCNFGEDYEVCEGDTCQSIADDFNVATDRFLYQNGIDFHCSNLPVGRKVCITECCELHTVAKNETCRDILKESTFTLTELLYWNPILHNDCGNIDSMVGRTLCVSPPGSTDAYDVDIEVHWNHNWTLPGPWEEAPTAGVDAPASALLDYWREIPTLTLHPGDGNAISTEVAAPTVT